MGCGTCCNKTTGTITCTFGPIGRNHTGYRTHTVFIGNRQRCEVGIVNINVYRNRDLRTVNRYAILRRVDPANGRRGRIGHQACIYIRCRDRIAARAGNGFIPVKVIITVSNGSNRRTTDSGYFVIRDCQRTQTAGIAGIRNQISIMEYISYFGEGGFHPGFFQSQIVHSGWVCG